VAFYCALQLAQFPVPYLYRCIFRAGRERREDGVECDAGNGRAVGLEGMSCGGSGQPARGILVFAEKRCRGAGVQLALETLIALFKLQDLRA
jgi:hypothetical protein